MNLLPALMIPIYTYRISPSEYGVLELLNRSQEILLLFLSFGLRSALLTFYQMGKDEEHRQKNVYSTALQFLIGFGFLVTVLALFASGFWSKLLFGTRYYGQAVVLILLGTFFEMVFQMAVLYLQSELKSSMYVTVFTTRLVLAIILNLWLVYWWRWGLMGILWATLIHTVVYSVAVTVHMFRQTGMNFSRPLLDEMLRFGAPLMVGAFAMFILNNGDRYFLNIYGTRADVGLYALGYKIGILSMSLVLMPFGKIWSVTMVDISKRPDGPVELGKIATYLIAACTISTLGLSLLCPYAIRLLAAPAYWEGYRVVPLVGAAYIFYSWTVIMDASFYVTKKTLYKLYNVTIAGAVVSLFYYLLIPRYGMMGAAWATLAGFASFAGTTALFAQRVYYIRYEMFRIALLFALGLMFYKLGSFIPVTPMILGIALRTLVTLAYPVALWLGGFVREEERKAIGAYWQVLRVRYLSGAEAQARP